MEEDVSLKASDEDLARLLEAAKKARNYADQLRAALDRVHLACVLLEDEEARDLIQHLTIVRDPYRSQED